MEFYNPEMVLSVFLDIALAGVAQFVGASSHAPKAMGWTPGQGTRLGCRFDPRLGFCAGLSLSLALSFSLSLFLSSSFPSSLLSSFSLKDQYIYNFFEGWYILSHLFILSLSFYPSKICHLSE